jgi:hypothetical protein
MSSLSGPEAAPARRDPPPAAQPRTPRLPRAAAGPHPTSNPANPCGSSRATSTRSTDARPGPARQNATSASTASSGPSKTASTVPSSQLRAHPATPRRAASRRTESRKKTPCTRPCARMRTLDCTLASTVVTMAAVEVLDTDIATPAMDEPPASGEAARRAPTTPLAGA